MIFSIIKTYLYDLWDSFGGYKCAHLLFTLLWNPFLARMILKNDFLSDKNCISQKLQEKLLNTIAFLTVLKSDWRYILDLIKSHCWNLILSSDKDTCWFKFHWTNTEPCYDQILFKFKKLVVVFLLLLCVAIEKILAEKLFIWMRDGHLPFVNNWTANYRA